MPTPLMEMHLGFSHSLSHQHFVSLTVSSMSSPCLNVSDIRLCLVYSPEKGSVNFGAFHVIYIQQTESEIYQLRFKRMQRFII